MKYLKLAKTRQAYVIITLLILCSCARAVPVGSVDKSLRDVVVVADKVADTLLIVQQAATQAETNGLLTRNQTRAVMEVSLKIFQANNDVMNTVRSLNQLSDTSKQNLINILTPLLAGIDTALNDQNLLNIQNVQTRDIIRGTLTTIRTYLNSMNLMLALR